MMTIFGEQASQSKQQGLRTALINAALAASLAFACGEAAAQTDGITGTSVAVGMSSPLTGFAGPGCKVATDAEQAWFDKVNKEGGIHGRKINLTILDDAYQAAQAVGNAKKLVEDKVFAYYGSCGTVQLPAVFPLMKAAGIPFLFPYASLDQYNKEPLFYSLITPYGEQVTALLRAKFKELGAGSVATILVDVPGSESELARVKAVVEQNGGTWSSASARVPTSVSDWGPLVLKLQAEKPDYVVIMINMIQASQMVKVMQARGYFPAKHILAPNYVGSSSFAQAVGDWQSGKITVAMVTAGPDSPDAAECRSVITAAGIVVENSSLYGCGSAQVLTAAMNAAGKDMTRAKLLAVLEGWKGQRPSKMFPPLTFTSARHVGPDAVFSVTIDSKGAYVTGPLVPVNNN